MSVRNVGPQVYEQRAPPFARESARWSAVTSNVDEYLRTSPPCMGDVLGVGFDAALTTLPPEERVYAGNNMGQVPWPYDAPE